MALTSFTSLFATEWPLSRMFRKLKLLSKSSPGYVICCLWTMPKPLTTWSIGRQTQVEPANSMASWGGGAVKISQKSSRISSPCAARIQVCVTFRTKADKAIKSPLCVCVWAIPIPNYITVKVFLLLHTPVSWGKHSYSLSDRVKWKSDQYHCLIIAKLQPVPSQLAQWDTETTRDRQTGSQVDKSRVSSFSLFSQYLC